MPGITPHTALSRWRSWPLNGTRSNGWTSTRRSIPFRRYLTPGRQRTETLPPNARTNSAFSHFRYYFSCMSKYTSWYSRQQHRRPYITEICSMVLIYSAGDLCAQIIGGDGYDARRTLRSITIGVVIAIPTYTWFRFLGRNFNYSSALVSTLTKVVVNQLIYTNFFNVYFFTAHAVLSGMAIPEVLERVRNTVPTSLSRSFLYWPFVTAFNLTYVQPQSRSVVVAIFSMFWQSYMSWLNARAEKREKSDAIIHASE